MPLRSDCARFFAYSALIISFKGVHMKLKVVALAISVEYLISTIFSDASQLSYRPSHFAQANKPYALG